MKNVAFKFDDSNASPKKWDGANKRLCYRSDGIKKRNYNWRLAASRSVT